MCNDFFAIFTIQISFHNNLMKYEISQHLVNEKFVTTAFFIGDWELSEISLLL